MTRLVPFRIAAALFAFAALPVASSFAAPGDAFLLADEPAKVQNVVAVRQQAKNGDQVAVVGRIGGRVTPWIKGAAAFSIVDTTAIACNERPEDNCPTPWDYCCEADLPKKTMLVTLYAGGKLVRADAREFLGVKELQTVVVEGQVKRDVSGNVSLVASKIFIRPQKSLAP